MELRKAKSACLFSRQPTDRSLSRYMILTYNLFMECLHLISDYHKFFFSFRMPRRGRCIALLFFRDFFLGWLECGSSACLDNEKPHFKCFTIIGLLCIRLGSCWNPIKRVGYKRARLRNIQHRRNRPFPPPRLNIKIVPLTTSLRNERKMWKNLIVGIYNSTFLLLGLYTKIKKREKNTQLRNELWEHEATMIIRSSDWFWAQNLVVFVVELLFMKIKKTQNRRTEERKQRWWGGVSSRVLSFAGNVFRNEHFSDSLRKKSDNEPKKMTVNNLLPETIINACNH